MQARVRESSKLKVITACSGINFVKHQWFEVPPEREEEALNNPYLEIRVEVEEVPTVAQVDQSDLQIEEVSEDDSPVPQPERKKRARVTK